MIDDFITIEDIWGGVYFNDLSVISDITIEGRIGFVAPVPN
jgi:hypothetical protein